MSVFDLNEWLANIDINLFTLGLTPNCAEEDVEQVIEVIWGYLANEYSIPPISRDALKVSLRSLRDYERWKIDFHNRAGKLLREVATLVADGKQREAQQEGGESSDELDQVEDSVNQALASIGDWLRR